MNHREFRLYLKALVEVVDERSDLTIEVKIRRPHIVLNAGGVGGTMNPPTYLFFVSRPYSQQKQHFEYTHEQLTYNDLAGEEAFDCLEQFIEYPLRESPEFLFRLL